MNSEILTGMIQPDGEVSDCPICARPGVSTSWIDHSFLYGSGESAVELVANIPVRRCEDCDFDFLDEVAERIKHEAVCERFGVMSPSDIRSLREGNGMTRAKFAHLTGIGEASLNRWENGINIQSHANDRYLRLLTHPWIMHQLAEIVDSRSASRASTFSRSGRRFREIQEDDIQLRKHQKGFQLRAA